MNDSATGRAIGSDTIAAQLAAGNAFWSEHGATFKRLSKSDQEQLVRDLMLTMEQIAGNAVITHCPGFDQITSAPNISPGLNRPVPAIAMQVTVGGAFVAIWWKTGSSATSWTRIDVSVGFEQIDYDPRSAPGLDRPLLTPLVWQVDSLTSPTVNLALFGRTGLAVTAWAKIWPVSGGALEQIDYDPSAPNWHTGNLVVNGDAETATGSTWWGGGIPVGRRAWDALKDAPYHHPVVNKSTYGTYTWYAESDEWPSQLYDASAYASEIDAGKASIWASAYFEQWCYIGGKFMDVRLEIGFYADSSSANLDRDPPSFDHALGTAACGYYSGIYTTSVTEDVPTGTRVLLFRQRFWGNPGGIGTFSAIDNIDVRLYFEEPGLDRDVGTEVLQMSDGTIAPLVQKWIKYDTDPHDWKPELDQVSAPSGGPSTVFTDAEVDSSGCVLDTGSNLNITSVGFDWFAMTTVGYSLGDERQVTFACAASATGEVAVGAGLAALSFRGGDQVLNAIAPGDTFRFKLMTIGGITYWREM